MTRTRLEEIRLVFADGTQQVLVGDHAEEWREWLEHVAALGRIHGLTPPDAGRWVTEPRPDVGDRRH